MRRFLYGRNVISQQLRYISIHAALLRSNTVNPGAQEAAIQRPTRHGGNDPNGALTIGTPPTRVHMLPERKEVSICRQEVP